MLELPARMISFTNVTKQYGGQVLFVDASFQVNAGEKVGLVGPNGSGKTTIFRLITGEELARRRQRRAAAQADASATSARTSATCAGARVLAETIAGAGEVAALGEELASARAQDGGRATISSARVERFGEVQARYQELGGYEIEARAHTILSGLGLAPSRSPTTSASSPAAGRCAWRWRRSCCSRPTRCCSTSRPTTSTSSRSCGSKAFLRDYPGAVVMTCHDRDVMNRVVKKIVEIDGGDVRSYTGDYDFYEQARALDAVQREAAYERQQAMLAKEMRFVERFRAQAAKAAQVQSRIKKLEKIERVEPPRRLVEREFDFKRPPRSGDDVVKVADVSQDLRRARGARRAQPARAARRALGGDGRERRRQVDAAQDDGRRAAARSPATSRVGASVTMGYFAQHQMEQLDGERTVLEELQAHAPTTGIGVLRNLAGAFGFHGDDVDKPVRVLSGGEKARLALAKILFDAPNLLVLDEPTNHLDIATKRALLKALARVRGHGRVRVARPRLLARAGDARARAGAGRAAARLRRALRRVRGADRPRGAGHARRELGRGYSPAA